MNEPLLMLQDVTVAHTGGTIALENVTWTLHAGETWAVVGPVGSGKSSFLEAIRGQRRVLAGNISWPLVEQRRSQGDYIAWPTEVIALVAFKEESPHFSYGKHYYQQRFNFIEAEDDLSLRAFLASGTTTTPCDIEAIAQRVGIAHVLDLSLIKLSNGQTRRARIGKALLSRPALLLLDDPMMGLDAAGREDIAALLGSLIAAGQRLVLVARPQEIPSWVTHVLHLQQQRCLWSGPKESFVTPDEPTDHTAIDSENHAREPVIELHNVSVTYGERQILRAITWTVGRGERWAVLGPNGSGKSTLLSLILGDHPQVYANDVRVFGKARGSGESIWDVKRPMGMVSPELHLYFSTPLTVRQVVATGFFDVLVPRPTTPDQDAAVEQYLRAFSLDAHADRLFARLSTGEQRLVLVLRAIIKKPALLILDEPFQGLDQLMIERLKCWLTEELDASQTLLFVTHYPTEIPACVTHRLQLEQGQILTMGTMPPRPRG